MNKLSIFFYLCLTYNLSWASLFPADKNGILSISGEIFDDVLKQHDVLVYFYGPSCGAACDKLDAELEKLAHVLSEGKVRLARADVSVESHLAARFDAHGVPQLRLWRGGPSGRQDVYEGDHTADAVLAWLDGLQPAVQTLESVQQLKAFVAADQVAVVGFFADRPAADTFLQWAETDGRYPAAVVYSDEVRQHSGAAHHTVVLFKKYDERRHELEGPVDAAELSAWTAKMAPPLLLEFSAKNQGKVFAGERTRRTALMLFLDREAARFEERAQAARDVAKDYRGEMLFALVEVSDPAFKHVVEFFGLTRRDAPAMRLLTSGEMTKYVPKKHQKVDRQGIREFVREFLAGEIKPHYNSEELPADWDARPLKVLVGSNFDSVVLDRTKDVLVDFYAPWCGHCKKLEPQLEMLAEAFKDVDSVLIAKINGMTNELPHTKLRSFPTIKMWRKGTNEVIEYNGERTAQGMAKFIQTGGQYGRAPPEQDYDDYEDYDEDADYEYKPGHDEL